MFCNILQYLNITVFLRLLDEYVGGVTGDVKLIVSAYIFTYLFEEFQYNVSKMMQLKPTLKICENWRTLVS